jgi:hypothetical protein
MNIRFISVFASLRSLFTGVALATVVGFLVPPSTARATLVTTWTQNAGSNGSNLNTASPVLGTGATDSGDNQQINAATASSYTLSSVGDSVSLTGGVAFTGLATPQADQFRFGLYDVNGQSGTTGWLGYFATNAGNPSGGTGPTVSNLWERSNPNSGSFGSGTGAVSISSVGATPSGSAFVSGNYTFSLTITRVSTGLELGWSMTGTDVTYSFSKTIIDTTPQTYTFNRVGIFTGGGLNADQLSFSNIDVTYASAVPEPASWAGIAAAVALAAACMRRRSRV